MKLKDFIIKFTNKELLDGDNLNDFHYSDNRLYMVRYGIKLLLAKYYGDIIMLKFRDDVKSGIKKVFKLIPKDKKVMLCTRELEYVMEPTNFCHETTTKNIIYYFVQGDWYDYFKNNNLDIYKYIFDYVDEFNCLDDFKLAVVSTTEEGYRNDYAFNTKKSIGAWWDSKYEKVDKKYLDKFLYIFRQYKLYQLLG